MNGLNLNWKRKVGSTTHVYLEEVASTAVVCDDLPRLVSSLLPNLVDQAKDDAVAVTMQLKYMFAWRRRN